MSKPTWGQRFMHRIYSCQEFNVLKKKVVTVDYSFPGSRGTAKGVCRLEQCVVCGKKYTAIAKLNGDITRVDDAFYDAMEGKEVVL